MKNLKQILSQMVGNPCSKNNIPFQSIKYYYFFLTILPSKSAITREHLKRQKLLTTRQFSRGKR